MSFYMNMRAGVLNEGEQAEAYKKRKAEEKWATRDDENKADERHNRVTSAYYDKQSNADKKHIEREYNKYYGDRNPNDSKASYATKSRVDASILKRAAKDAGVRPKHEFGIFSECYFINEAEQAEAYKERKVKEKWATRDDENKADERHEKVTSAYYDKQSDADKERIETEYNKYNRDINDSKTDYGSKSNTATSLLKRAAKDAGVRPKR